MDLLALLLGGTAVLLVTMVADRLGGRLGGMLATAPMATSAAFLSLAKEGGMADKVAAGGMSIFAAIAAMPVFFMVLKASRRWTTQGADDPPWVLPARMGTALGAYVLGFTILTLLVQAVTPPSIHLLWYVVTMVLVGILSVTFVRVPIESTKVRGARPPLHLPEMAARFAAGAGVVALVDVVSTWNPVLGAAWAVFPGTFLVGLTVMGLAHGAAFAGRASQAGVLGAVPLTAFLFAYYVLVGMHEAVWWSWSSLIPAWGVYFLVLAVVGRPPTPQPGTPAVA